jgi:hypothetical protein
MQEVGERADLLLALVDERQRLLDRLVRLLRELRRCCADPFSGEARADEELRRAVVQLTRDPAPLVVLQRQQPPAETTKRLRSAPGLGDVVGAAENPRDLPITIPGEHRLAPRKPAPAAIPVAQPMLASGDLAVGEHAQLVEAAFLACRIQGMEERAEGLVRNAGDLVRPVAQDLGGTEIDVEGAPRAQVQDVDDVRRRLRDATKQGERLVALLLGTLPLRDVCGDAEHAAGDTRRRAGGRYDTAAAEQPAYSAA